MRQQEDTKVTHAGPAGQQQQIFTVWFSDYLLTSASRSCTLWQWNEAGPFRGSRRTGTWHLPSAFNHVNVDILAVIISVSLGRNGEAISMTRKIDLAGTQSVVRRSRLLLEVAQAYSNRLEREQAVRALTAAVRMSPEAVALIPWARTLADELADQSPRSVKSDAAKIAAQMKTIE